MIKMPACPSVIVGTSESVLQALLQALQATGTRQVACLADENCVRNPACTKVVDELKNCYRDDLCLVVKRFSEPSIDSILETVKLLELREEKPRVVVALGGGSTIDTAKAVAYLLSHPEHSLPDRFTPALALMALPLPVVAVPTTAGTGAELSAAAVYLANGRKVAVVNDRLIPIQALVAPEFTYSLPRRESITCAGDALSHSVEGLMSQKSCVLSDVLHRQAIKMLLDAFSSIGQGLISHDHRHLIAEGSLMSGLGARIAGANVVHALAAPVAEHYSLRHGLGVTIGLKAVLQYLLLYRPDSLALLDQKSCIQDCAAQILRVMDALSIFAQVHSPQSPFPPSWERSIEKQQPRFVESLFSIEPAAAPEIWSGLEVPSDGV